jgi:hypothetical protein
MRTTVRVFAAALVAGLLASITVGGPARAADDQTSELNPVGARAFQQLGECLSPKDSTLNVLYVLDASSSLADDTDTEGLRFGILAQSLRQLGALSQDRQINTAVASFDLGFDERQPWQQVDQASATALADWANSRPQWWGAGQGTNWEAALEQGDALMRQAPGFKDACNMLVWVTDGGINVDGDWSEVDKNAAAMKAICATDPVTGEPLNRPAIVDSMRTSGIHLIGVLLQSAPYLDALRGQGADGRKRAAVEESRQGYMRPLTEGEGPVDTTGFTSGKGSTLDYLCGGSPLDEGRAAGALLLGSSPIALAYQLGSLSGRLAGAQPVEVSDGPPYTFTVPAGVNLIDAQIAGENWSVVSPDGNVVATPDAANTPGVSVISEGGLAGVRLAGDVVSDGTWTINVTEPPARPRVSLAAQLEGTYAPAELRVGETATVVFAFTDQFTGQPASADDYRVGEIDVQARAGRESTPLACVPASDAIAVSCEFTPEQVGTATIDASVTIVTAEGEPPFTTEFTGTFDQPVLPAATFPQVSPDAVALSDLDGKRGTATGTVTVVGPEEGSGQVCFPEASDVRIDSDVVDRASEYNFSTTAWGQCLSVGTGEQVTVPISVTNPVPATGSVQASFDVTLKSDATDATYPQTVSLTFDTIRQGTPPWWLLLALVAAGVGIPLGLLYLQSLAASKLSMKGLRMASVPVQVTMRPSGASVERRTASADGATTLTSLDDWQYMSTSLERPRTARVAEGITLAAVTPRGPLSPLRAEARAPSGARIVTDAGTPDGGVTAPMGLAPAGQWILLAREADLTGLDPEEGTFPATLVAFLAGPADANEMNTELTTGVKASDGSLAWAGVIRHLSRPVTPASAPDGDASVPDGGRSKDELDELFGGDRSAATEPPSDPGPPPSPRRPQSGPRPDDDDPFAGL